MLLVVAMKLGWEGRIYAQVTCAVLYGLIAIYVCCRYRLFLFKGISWFKIRPILMWGVPLIPHLATSWIKQGGDRYIINYYYTFAEVGIFSFALNLSNIIDMIGSAFNQTNSVSIYQVLSSNLDDKWERLQRQIKAIFIVYTIGVVAVLAVCSILIPWYCHDMQLRFLTSTYWLCQVTFSVFIFFTPTICSIMTKPKI